MLFHAGVWTWWRSIGKATGKFSAELLWINGHFRKATLHNFWEVFAIFEGCFENPKLQNLYILRNISKLEFVMPGETFKCILNSCKWKKTAHVINVDDATYIRRFTLSLRVGSTAHFNLSGFKKFCRVLNVSKGHNSIFVYNREEDHFPIHVNILYWFKKIQPDKV